MAEKKMTVAQEIDQKPFGDGNKFTCLCANGNVVRSFTQNGAETIILNGQTGHLEYRHNYLAVVENGAVVAVAWPQD